MNNFYIPIDQNIKIEPIYIIGEVEIKYNISHEYEDYYCILYIHSKTINNIISDELVIDRFLKTYQQLHSQYINFDDISNIKYKSTVDIDADYKTIEDLENKKRNCFKNLFSDIII